MLAQTWKTAQQSIMLHTLGVQVAIYHFRGHLRDVHDVPVARTTTANIKALQTLYLSTLPEKLLCKILMFMFLIL